MIHESRLETLFKTRTAKDISRQPSTVKSAQEPLITLATISEVEIE